MRRCFFIFDYDNDLARAMEIGELGLEPANAPAGFDASRWMGARNTGPAEVQRLIDEALKGTSATVVLIGERTAELDYVDYAIDQSIRRQNGILGIFIHELKDENGETGTKGAMPYASEAAELLEAHGYAAYDWDPERFAEWVEEAATVWKKFARPEPLNKPLV